MYKNVKVLDVHGHVTTPADFFAHAAAIIPQKKNSKNCTFVVQRKAFRINTYKKQGRGLGSPKS